MDAAKIASLLAVLALTAPAEVVAQQEPIVAPGNRVRVTAPGSFWPRACTVIALKNDTLVLDVGRRAAPVHLALAEVEQLEVSRGRTSNAFRGALIGAGLGLALGVAAAESDPDSYICGSVVVGFLGGVGAAVGLVIGAMSRSDRWKDVPLDQLRVSILPQRKGGLSVGLRVRT